MKAVRESPPKVDTKRPGPRPRDRSPSRTATARERHIYPRNTLMFVKLTSAFMGSAAAKILDVPESEGKLLIEKGIALPQGDEVLSPLIAKAMETMTTKVTESINSVID